MIVCEACDYSSIYSKKRFKCVACERMICSQCRDYSIKGWSICSDTEDCVTFSKSKPPTLKAPAGRAIKKT